MDNDSHFSRVEKYKKRRSVKRSIITLSLLGLLLLFTVIFMTVLSGKNSLETKNNNDKATRGEERVADANAQEEDPAQAKEEQEHKEDISTENVDVPTKELENHEEILVNDSPGVNNLAIEAKTVPSDDPNVIVAKEGDWLPIGTVQEEPHELDFKRDSIDWQEMIAAIESVVPLENMTIHWLGNGGEQKAIGTVSTSDNSEVYRVFLSWIAEEGWQPTRVEQLEQVEIIR